MVEKTTMPNPTENLGITDFLKSPAILLDTTVKRSKTKLKDMKPYWE